LSQQSLNEILLCTTTVDQAIAAGRVKADGNRARLDEPLTLLDNFDPLFNIVTLCERKLPELSPASRLVNPWSQTRGEGQ